MSLRELLNLCQDRHSGEWVLIPGGRPATAMLAGVFDPGVKEHALTRPLAGHSTAVYEPDPALSMVRPVPEEPEAEELEPFNRPIPEWAELDGHDWKHARLRYAVVLLGGAPIWQEPVWYLDWGAGIGGYTPYIEAVFGDDGDGGERAVTGWTVSAWAVGLARLINSFSAPREWYTHDPTSRVVPQPDQRHPLDAAIAGR